MALCAASVCAHCSVPRAPLPCVRCGCTQLVCGYEYTLVVATEHLWRTAPGDAVPAKVAMGVLYGSGDNGCGQLGSGTCEGTSLFRRAGTSI